MSKFQEVINQSQNFENTVKNYKEIGLITKVDVEAIDYIKITITLPSYDVLSFVKSKLMPISPVSVYITFEVENET